MTTEAAPMCPVRYRVVERRVATVDAVTLTLEPLDDPLPVGAPGQFLMLWAFGLGEVPISLAGYDDEGRVEQTIRAVGTVTAALCDAPQGTVVGARGPFGTGFDLGAAEGRDLLVLGGGIGLAPVRPVILAARRDRDRFDHVTVLVGARSPEHLLYLHEMDAWREADIDVALVVDAAPPGWPGQVGVVTKLIPPALNDAARTTAVMCGPEVMMRFAATELLDRGVAPEAIQVSLERNMHCALGLCGRCQLGPHMVCRDGPVFPWPVVSDILRVRER